MSILYGNKDGKYAWRKYEIINPLVYVSLVNIVTEKNNWVLLQNRFKDFQKDKNIECESVPVRQRDGTKQKATQISYWVENIDMKTFTELFNIILTGNKEDGCKAAREVRKLLYSSRNDGKYDEIETTIENAPMSELDSSLY